MKITQSFLFVSGYSKEGWNVVCQERGTIFFPYCLKRFYFILFLYISDTASDIYTTNQAWYIMIQGPDGVPVAIPVQSGGGMIAIQASGA